MATELPTRQELIARYARCEADTRHILRPVAVVGFTVLGLFLVFGIMMDERDCPGLSDTQRLALGLPLAILMVAGVGVIVWRLRRYYASFAAHGLACPSCGKRLATNPVAAMLPLGRCLHCGERIVAADDPDDEPVAPPAQLLPTRQELNTCRLPLKCPFCHTPYSFYPRYSGRSGRPQENRTLALGRCQACGQRIVSDTDAEAAARSRAAGVELLSRRQLAENAAAWRRNTVRSVWITCLMLLAFFLTVPGLLLVLPLLAKTWTWLSLTRGENKVVFYLMMAVPVATLVLRTLQGRRLEKRLRLVCPFCKTRWSDLRRNVLVVATGRCPHCGEWVIADDPLDDPAPESLLTRGELAVAIGAQVRSSRRLGVVLLIQCGVAFGLMIPVGPLVRAFDFAREPLWHLVLEVALFGVVISGVVLAIPYLVGLLICRIPKHVCPRCGSQDMPHWLSLAGSTGRCAACGERILAAEKAKTPDARNLP
jgi:hypothetical protein